jgi:hypothetical protein
VGIGSDEGIQDGVADLVTDLVWVTFGNGFGCEEALTHNTPVWVDGEWPATMPDARSSLNSTAEPGRIVDPVHIVHQVSAESTQARVAGGHRAQYK